MKFTKYTVLRLIFAVIGLGFIIASMVYEGEHNWFLPFGLFFIPAANVIYYLESKK